MGGGPAQVATTASRDVESRRVDHDPAAPRPLRRGSGAAAPTSACRPSVVGPRPACRAGRPGVRHVCDGLRLGSSGSAGVRCSAQHWRTSAGRAWAPPQYTHEITPATLTTGCDSDRERGVLPRADLDRFPDEGHGRAGRNPHVHPAGPVRRLTPRLARGLDRPLVAGTCRVAVRVPSYAGRVRRSTTHRGCSLQPSPLHDAAGRVGRCRRLRHHVLRRAVRHGLGRATGAGRRRRLALERLLVQRLACPRGVGVDLHRRQPGRSVVSGRARSDPRLRARPVRGLPRRDRRQGLPRPRRQRLLVPLHERQRRLELPERRPDRPVQPRVGSGDRHQRRRQPDPELLLDRRRDRVHDADPDRHAAVGDPDRREVGPLLGRLRLERRMPEHVDPAHRRVARPTSLRVPWHAAAGGRDRRLQPAQRPERRSAATIVDDAGSRRRAMLAVGALPAAGTRLPVHLDPRRQAPWRR